MELDIPNEIVDTVAKTVQYVLKNGISFEERLMGNNDAAFAFISPNNQYHEYYKSQLETAKASKISDGNLVQKLTGDGEITLVTPPILLFHNPLPAVSLCDLKVIKATALAVACNPNDEYLEKLVSHEQDLGNHAQFEFTVKSHSLYETFIKFIDQYKAILNHIKAGDEIIQCRIYSDKTVAENAKIRSQFNSQERSNMKHNRKQREQEQLRYASIDWQSFCFAGIIEFDAIDEVKQLPIPISRHDLMFRSLDTKSECINEKIMKNEHTESETVIKTDISEIDESAPGAKILKGMKVRAAGLSRAKAAADTQQSNIVCPLTRKIIPEPEFDAHLRSLLRDPRYQQQQESYMRKNFANASSLTSTQVFENIQRLVRKRQAPQLELRKKKT